MIRNSRQQDIRYPEVLLPQIDVTDRVMAAINRPHALNRKPWIAVSMIAILIVACGFGFATAAGWKLFDANGSVVLEYRAFIPGDEPVRGVDVDKLRELLPVGEAALFYLKETNDFISIANEQAISSYSVFRNMAGDTIPPERIGNDFVFSQGLFSHVHHPDLNLMEELKQTAALSSDSYQYGLINIGEVSGFSANYTHAEGAQLTVSGFYGESWATVYSNLEDEEMMKLQLGDKEVLYITNQHDGNHQMIWRDQAAGKAVYYKLQATRNSNVTVEELESTVLSIMAKN